MQGAARGPGAAKAVVRVKIIEVEIFMVLDSLTPKDIRLVVHLSGSDFVRELKILQV